MLAFVRLPHHDDKKRLKYHCALCGVFIASGEARTPIMGVEEHSYVNPAGIRCHFLSFRRCDHTRVGDMLYREHSWFPAYGWRFALCEGCAGHLGWRYDAIDPDQRPPVFYGLLARALKVRLAEGR